MTICFLVYLNRSGSTLLARMLDEYDDIGVTPEARFPDGITCRRRVIRNHADIEMFLDSLYRYDRFRSWGLPKRDLRKRLSDQQKPIHFKDVLPLLMGDYFKKAPTRIQIYKSPYLFEIKKVKRLFPHAKFLCIIRDLRAIYTSQKNTTETDHGRIMATDPIKPALSYNLACRIVQQYRSESWFRWLTFEDLIKNPEEELHPVIEFLGASPNKSKTTDAYFGKLSEMQQTIHPNIQSPPLPERIDAWRKEIEPEELYILQGIAEKSMRYFGYDILKTPRLSGKERIRLLGCFLRFCLTFYNKYSLLKAFIKTRG